MSINTYLPFASTLVMLIFTVSVFQRFVVRRNLAFLFWGMGLLMFGLGSFAEAYFYFAWSRAVFVMWYLFGAILTPAWIGQGTLYLLVRKRWVHLLTAVLVLGSLISAGLMLSIPLVESAYQPGVVISQQYKAIIPHASFSQILVPTILFGTYGIILLVGGALYSAFLFWRKRVLPNRVIGNVLIAAGALSVALASAVTGLGFGQYLYIGEFVAAVMMYGGFLMAAAPSAEPAPAEQTAVATTASR